MTARIIDGRAIAAGLLEEAGRRARALSRRPALAVVIAGGDPASRVYVRSKIRACRQCGVESLEFSLPGDCGEDELLALIARLNADDAVDGILLQMPLPPHVSADRVISAIRPDKDIDGFHPANAGALACGRPEFAPCTPLAVMRMLDSTGVSPAGLNAVVIGRSAVVGRPAALMLLARDATVTVAHSRTRDLPALARGADILIAAAGRPGLVTGGMIKPGAVVIDVGINRGPDGGLCGDVRTDEALDVAGWVSPVPGGVGPVTTAMLMSNTLRAAEIHQSRLP